MGKRAEGCHRSLRARWLAAGLLHALFRIPRALQLAHIHDLADVIGIVRRDVGDGGGHQRQLLVVGGFDQFLEIGHHLIELLHRVRPLFVVELGESLVVVPAELRGRLSFEPEQVLAIPEEQVIGELAGRMPSAARLPTGLFGGESVDGGIDRHEPIGFVVGGLELVEQEAAQRGRFLTLRL